jgi:glycine oxidase
VAVTLVERSAVGREASWAAAGYLSYQGEGTTGARLDIRRASHAMYARWIDELRELTPADTGFARCGLLEICLDEKETAEARVRAAWQTAAGFKVDWLDSAAIRSRHPYLSEALPIEGGLLFPEVAQVRPPRLLKALAEAVRRLGVRVREHSPVAAITRDGDRATGVLLASGERIAAGAVVNAAGAWATQIAPEMTVMPVRPIKGTIVMLEEGPALHGEILVSSRGSLYPRPDGRVLLGATMEDAGFDRQVRVDAMQALMRQGLSLVPGLANASFGAAWTGFRPFSHDSVPYLGAVPGLQNAHAAAGHHRSGILMAPVTGLLLRQIVLRQPLALPLAPYEVGRART